jgi:tRNA A37 N6-isopentenylltransferase MiaA
MMMEAGLLGEVTSLKRQGLTAQSQAGQAIGYKQLLQYVSGGMDIDDVVAAIKQESRRYAKRQLTWFRRNPAIIWLDAQKALDGDVPERLATALRQSALTGDEERGLDDFVDFVKDAGLFVLEHI